MIGSIDFYAWKWEKCPSAFNDAYMRDKGTSVMLEVIVDHWTWVWHAFAGVPGSMNDIMSSSVPLAVMKLYKESCPK